MLQNELDALVALGRLERAELIVTHLERLAAATGRSWTQAIAARGRALLLAPGGDFGTIERRAKQKRASREALEQALELPERLPAPLWAEKARG